MAYAHNSGSPLRIFLKNLHTERGEYVDGSNVNDFYRRFFIQGKWGILDQKWHIVRIGPESVLRNFLKFCRMNGANSAWNLY